MGVQSSPGAGSKPKTTTRTRTASAKSHPVPPALVDQDLRRSMIAQAAYYRAERRGFAPGSETEDWLAAEREIDAALMLGAPLKKA